MISRTGLLAALAVAVAAVSLLAASGASAFVYWADSQNSRIGRAANDGSGVTDAFIATGQLPIAVAVDSQHLYWANQNGNSIGRAKIDGSEVNNAFITGITHPSGVAVNGSSIFWSSLAGQVGKAKLDGTGVNKNLVTGIPEPCGVALDSGHVYWIDDATGSPAYVGRAGLDGSVVDYSFISIPGTTFPCGIAVNSANIFWSDVGFFAGGTKIGRAGITGSGPDPNFIAGADGPCGIAVHGTLLYWSNAGTNAIARANTDGTSLNQSFIQTGGSQICGIAVDDLAPAPLGPPTPTPAPTPGRPTAKIVSGPGKALVKGKATFKFQASEAGAGFECKLDRGKVARCKPPKKYSHLKPGRHSFKVWAVGAGGKSAKPATRKFRVPRPHV